MDFFDSFHDVNGLNANGKIIIFLIQILQHVGVIIIQFHTFALGMSIKLLRFPVPNFLATLPSGASERISSKRPRNSLGKFFLYSSSTALAYQ